MSIFWQQPVWRLQRVGDEVLDFLYPNQHLADRVDSIELRPGVAFCLRRFHVLITEIVRGAWVQYIRKVNTSLLGTTTDLTEFMLGSERTNLAVPRPMLVDLQAGRCFYCHGAVAGVTADLDRSIPWSRYPVDLGHNFVLAHGKCNTSKSSILACEEHLGRWAERNRTYGGQIARECDRVRFTSVLDATFQIAR
jgi:hypothetical protein